MIPNTKNNLPAMAVLSAMQKAVRRSMEVEAMQFAVELMSTSKGFFTMVVNRLEIVAHEDLDTLAAPHVVVFVATCIEQAKRHYDPNKIGRSRMMVGSAIRMMCAAPKSRIGDHFAAAIGLASELEGFVPVVPDWTKDGHTAEGKRMGRGLAYFREHSAQLVPPPTAPDPYEEAAYALWAKKAALAKQKPAADLFEE
jgi:replication-associated recombination protein RarA